MRRRRQKSRIFLPGESDSRRGFLKKGLVGGILLAAGGGGFLATRKTTPLAGPQDRFRVLSLQEAAVILAIADRLVPERKGFPRPMAMDLPAKVDALAARAHPATQKELRQLIRLFENALTGLLFEGVPQTFTQSTPEAQDRRLAGWGRSRVTLRRTGVGALRELIYAAYYASPEVYPALGYPGPPSTALLKRVRHDVADSAPADRPPDSKPERPPDHPPERPLERAPEKPERAPEHKPEQKPERAPEKPPPSFEPAEPEGANEEPRAPSPKTEAKPKSKPIEPKDVDSGLVGPSLPEPPAGPNLEEP